MTFLALPYSLSTCKAMAEVAEIVCSRPRTTCKYTAENSCRGWVPSLLSIIVSPCSVPSEHPKEDCVYINTANVLDKRVYSLLIYNSNC